MKSKINIFNRLKLGFGIILLIVVISTAFNIYNLDKNIQRNNFILNVAQPSSIELNKLYEIITESKLLIKNWVYIDKKPATVDKRKLISLQLNQFPILNQNIRELSKNWEQENIDLYDSVVNDINLLFEYHNSIMSTLNSFESYNDLSNIFISQSLVDENGDISSITDRILLQLNSLKETYQTFSNEKIEESNQNFTAYRWFILLNGISILGLVILIGSFVNKSIRINIQDREEARNKLTQHQKELESLVDKRTIDLKNEISDRRSIQFELEKEKIFINKIINNLPGTFYITDKENRFVRWNKNFENLTGLNETDIKNKDLFEFIAPDDTPILRYNFENVFKNEQINTEINFVTTNNTQIPFLVTIIKYEFDNEIYFLSFGINISSRKKAEIALKESQIRYKKFFENIFDAVIIVKSNGSINELNESANQLLKTSSFDKSDINITDFILKDGIDIFNDMISDLSKEIDINYSTEIKIKNFDDKVLDVELKASSIFIDDEKQFFVILKDITENKKFELERANFINELESKNTELERFTYTVSHDLKSPLITIKGFLGVLYNELEEFMIPSLESYFNRIKNAADNMQDLLEDLLELSRIGRLVNPSDSIDLNLLLDNTLELLAVSLSNKNIEVEVSVLPTIDIDRQRILEVFQNLIENSIKYIGEDNNKPYIKVYYTSNEKDHIFTVEDNGIGIEEQFHEKVFGLFDKLNNNSDGTGVGLALVKRIVEFHGGHIWVESEGLGKGTKFKFTLPITSTKTKV